jgi:class 3 adenylate cyclase
MLLGGKTRMSDASKPSIWITHEVSLTPYECVRLVERNKPLQENMVKIFSHILEELFLLFNRGEGIHLFINKEIDELHYISHTVAQRKQESSVGYKSIKNTNLLTWFEGNQLLNIKEPKIQQIDEANLKYILNKISFIDNTGYENGLIIPLDYEEINLGKFIIWGDRNRNRSKNIHALTLLGAITSWYSFLSNFFRREYRTDKYTYLPSYYTVGWKRASILFADIRNFTPMTEMLRNAYFYSDKTDKTPGPLQKIINEYCSEMAKVIQEENRGRIDKFMGDGIMSIFGEYDIHPSKVVTRALYVACQMIIKFRDLKREWQKIAFGGADYEIEYNEAVEIDLGIGIDYGSVLFDYLGDNIHRDYSIVGDHVNFAQRLELEAARYDEITQKKRPPILISRTSLRCCRPWLKNYIEVHLMPKGKGHTYTVYGIEPKDFDEALFITSEKNEDWESPWKNDKNGSPIHLLNL